MGVATQVETAIDTLLAGFVSSKSAAIAASLAPIAITGVTIYVIIIGWAIMRGDAQDPFHTALWKFFKITFIGALALGGAQYQSAIVDGITGIQGALISSFGPASSVGGLIDAMSLPYEDLYSTLMSEATTGVVPNLSLFLAGVIVALAQCVLLVIGLGMYLLAKVALALVLAVGPAFILCAMFPATQRFTESWLGQALAFVMLNVLIAASISMLTSFASQFAEHIKANVGTTSIMKDVVALLMVSGALGVVMLNLPTIATALTGGASISGVGREIGRAVMDRLGRKKDPKPQPEGGEIKPNANGDVIPHERSGGGSRGGSKPQYQRNVIENIRKSS